MALINLTQTDLSASCSADVYCNAATLATQFQMVRATDGGTAGTRSATATVGTAGDQSAVFFRTASNDILKTTWESGTWTVRINVTTANMNIDWNIAQLCVDTGSGCTFSAITQTSTAAINLGTTGVFTATIPMSTDRVAGLSDVPAIVCKFDFTGTMGTGAFVFIPNQNIDTPLSKSVAAVTIFNLATTGCGQ